MKKYLDSSGSFRQTMERAGNKPSGFDFMRPILALAVIANHTVLICCGDAASKGLWAYIEPLTYLIVPSFFALSGFLVAGSLERCKTLVSFLGLRVFRIFPALIVEVLISAIIIGPIFTTLQLTDYYSDPLFVRYFMNMLGEPQFHLPGVFMGNPTDLVNGQIWTIPYELACYICLSVIAVAGLYRRKWSLVSVIAACYAGQLLNTVIRPNASFAGPTGLVAVICFLCGILLYRWRDEVRHSRTLFLASVAVSLALIYTSWGIRFAALPIAYATVYLGLLNPRKPALLDEGDYSYGIYLYGFPLQQALFTASPVFQTPLANGIASAILATALAVLSWHFVEVPFMARKKVVFTWERWLVERWASGVARALRIRARTA